MSQSRISITALISKYQGAKGAWRTRYLNELKSRSDEFLTHFRSLPATEEQVLADLYAVITSV